MNKRVTVMLKMDPDVSATLRRASGITGQSVDDLVEEAARAWIAAHPDQAGTSKVERAFQESLERYDELYRRLAK